MPETAVAPTAQATPNAVETKAVVAAPVTPEPAKAATQAVPDAGAAGTKPGTDPKAVPAVPEKYELVLPKDSPLEASAAEKTALFAKEHGLSKEQAQALLERENGSMVSMMGAAKARAEEWVTEAKADKELGGEGFVKNAELAKRVVDRFATDSFKKALNDSGLGNHPELLRVFARIGKSMGEDRLVLPGAQPGTKRSPEDILYGGGKSQEQK